MIRPRISSSPVPVDWCDTVTIRTDEGLRSVAVGQPWNGMATWNPINMFGKQGPTDGHWGGWIYASDADTGVWKWRAKSNYPIVAAITPTAGGIVFLRRSRRQFLRVGFCIGGGMQVFGFDYVSISASPGA
jgi:hypothetical protein